MIKLLSIADIISITNSLFGFLSIIFLIQDYIHISFSFILIAILADGLDGFVARKTKKGKLGDYLEAMADMTSLAIAPAFFVYYLYSSELSWASFSQILLMIILLFFLCCSIIRLASFHIIKKDNYFVGLPASAATIIILVISYIGIDIRFIFALIFIISIALISPIKFPKTNLKVNFIAAVLIISSIIFAKNFSHFSLYVLFLSMIIYSIIGSLYLKFKNKKIK